MRNNIKNSLSAVVLLPKHFISERINYLRNIPEKVLAFLVERTTESRETVVIVTFINGRWYSEATPVVVC